MHISRSPAQAEMSARKSRRTNETTCLSAYKFYIKRKKKKKIYTTELEIVLTYIYMENLIEKSILFC